MAVVRAPQACDAAEMANDARGGWRLHLPLGYAASHAPGAVPTLDDVLVHPEPETPDERALRSRRTGDEAYPPQGYAGAGTQRDWGQDPVLRAHCPTAPAQAPASDGTPAAAPPSADALARLEDDGGPVAPPA